MGDGVTGGLRLAAAAALLSSAAAAPAWALDAQAFAAALVRTPVEPAPVSLTHGEPVVDGSTIVLPDLTLVYAPPAAIGPVPLGTVTFEGVEEVGADGYSYASASAGPLSGTAQTAEGALRWSVDGWRIEDALIPPTEPVEGMMDVPSLPFGTIGGLYERGQAGAVLVTLPNDVTMRTGGIDFEWDWRATPSPVAMDFGRIVLDMTSLSIPDPTIAAWVRENGYDRLTGGIEAEGAFDLESGAFDLAYEFIVENAGTLGYGIDVSGVTPEVVQGIQEAAPGMQSSDPEVVAAAGEAYLDALAPVRLGPAFVSFTDDGLTEALLDLTARQTGTPRETLRSTAAAGVPVGLGAVGLGSLVAPAFTAVQTFLGEPGTFRVAMEPDGPVSVGDVMAATEQSPAAVVELLNVTIEASAP